MHIDSEGSFVDVKDLFIYFKSEELHTHIYEDGLQSLTLLSKLKNEVQTANSTRSIYILHVTASMIFHDYGDDLCLKINHTTLNVLN